MDEILIKNITEPEQNKLTTEDMQYLEKIDVLTMLEELEGK